ncbi:hypothetical protein AAZX31_06G259600 [Glycine max]
MEISYSISIKLVFPVMASKLLHSSFYLMLFLLISNMAIANAALFKTKGFKILHIKGHNSHGETKVGGFAAPVYLSILPRGTPIPSSGPSLPINGRGNVP